MTDDSTAPSTIRLLSEVRMPAEWLAGLVTRRRLARGHDGKGRKVFVIPGFLAMDFMTRPLRRTLKHAGYRTSGWGLGQNKGLRPGLIEALEARVLAFAGEEMVALVGWSLGGVFAREIAKRHPGRVERVVTLGSPFSGDPRANNAWRHYEKMNDHPVDAPPIDTVISEKPPVLTIALWSAEDGMVAPASARGLPGEADRQERVRCSHFGFKCAPAALRAVLKALD